MRKLRLASLTAAIGLMSIPALGLSACGDEESNVPGQTTGPAQVEIDSSPTLSLQVNRPLWPYHVRWRLPKNIVMDKQPLEIDYTQTYEVGVRDLGYMRYTERVLTASAAGTEIGNPVGAEIALLKAEHPGAEDFPLGKLPKRVKGAGLQMVSADWTSTMHVYHIHLADPAPTPDEEDAKITGYLLTFESAGPPDHPWGVNGLFARAVYQTIEFATQ
jgi:hypothetical protein